MLAVLLWSGEVGSQGQLGRRVVSDIKESKISQVADDWDVREE